MEVTFEARALDQLAERIRTLVDATGADMLTEILIVGRNLAVSLAHSTQPYGLDTAAKKTGEAAVARDINKVFTTPSRFYQALQDEDPGKARQFWRAWTQRDIAGVTAIVGQTRAGSHLQVMDVPDERVHQGLRRKGGRVRVSYPRGLVLQTAALTAYRKEVVRRVGLTKAGWAGAARDCGGTRGIPGWASTRHRMHGGARIVRSLANPSVTLENRVDWLRDVLPAPVEQTAIDIAEERLIKRIDTILKKRAAQAR